jgi:hypothetical protein
VVRDIKKRCWIAKAHQEIPKKTTNNKTFKQKMTTPITFNPGNWKGKLYSRMETIPVPMLTENQEGVKLRIRRRHSRENTLDGGAGVVVEDILNGMSNIDLKAGSGRSRSTD